MKASVISKLLISLGVLFYLIVIPVLEWNQSHVFNSTWPPHARFHEVWQLATNMALGCVVLWLTWVRNQIVISAVISCCVMGGVIVSHVLSNYAGSSVQSGNIAKQVLGLELAVFVALLVVIMSILAAFLKAKRTHKYGSDV